MAFTPEEQQIINWSRQNGKTVQEMKDAIFRYRTTGSPVDPNSIQKKPSDISDVAIGAAKGLGESIKFAGGAAAQALPSLLPETSIIPGIKEGIDKGVSAIQDKIGLSDKNLEAKNDAQGLGKGTEVAAELLLPIGASKVAKLAKEGVESAGESLSKSKGLPQFIKNIRFGLSDIDPQVETILKRSSPDEVNTYFQHARNAKADPEKFTGLEIAGQKGEEAFDLINEARKSAVKGKKSILETVKDRRVSGNTINDVMSSGIQRMGEKFGATISAKGEISQTKGRTLQLDDKDAKLVGDYFSRLNSMGVSPSVKQVDDFVDWAQSQLYKQSKTVSKYEVASEPVVRELQRITGDLNKRLKAAVGGGYSEVNERISKLIELQDELSSSLGADARKGGGLMKRLFSPTGGNIRQIFTEIEKETGIDLFKEATLAKFAMESVGDVRQQSLLKQLDVLSKDAGELDLTKPMSIIRFIRERADLDAQELANEIIRRASANP